MRLLKYIFPLVLLTGMADAACAIAPFVGTTDNMGLILPEHSIAVMDEDMTIGFGHVDITYKLMNEGKEDSDNIITLPFPGIGLNEDINSQFVKAGKDMFGFSVEVDGKKVTGFEKEIRSTYEPPMDGDSVDMVKELAAFGIQMNEDIPAMVKAINALPMEKKELLAGKGHLSFTRTEEPGQYEQLVFNDSVGLDITYRWKQHFPAGKMVTVHLGYVPSIRRSIGQIEKFPKKPLVGDDMYAIGNLPALRMMPTHERNEAKLKQMEDKALAETAALYCLDNNARKRMAEKITTGENINRILEASRLFQSKLDNESGWKAKNEFSRRYASYINEASLGIVLQKIPVRHFKLTLVKNAPDDVAGSCINTAGDWNKGGWSSGTWNTENPLSISTEQNNYIYKGDSEGNSGRIDVLYVEAICSPSNPALPGCPKADEFGIVRE